MWKKVLNWVFGILLLVSLILSGVLLYRECHPGVPEVVYLHDTVTIKKDSIITKTLFKTKFDTIIEREYIDTLKHDTIKINDMISLPIEHKVDSFTLRKDSLTITEKIYHNGFHSNIDSVDFNYDFHYTLTEPKKKKFGWCITVGPSVSYGINFDTKNQTFSHGPEIGVSVVIGPSYIIK